jgi:hypothetical protein
MDAPECERPAADSIHVKNQALEGGVDTAP